MSLRGECRFAQELHTIGPESGTANFTGGKLTDPSIQCVVHPKSVLRFRFGTLVLSGTALRAAAVKFSRGVYDLRITRPRVGRKSQAYPDPGFTPPTVPGRNTTKCKFQVSAYHLI